MFAQGVVAVRQSVRGTHCTNGQYKQLCVLVWIYRHILRLDYRSVGSIGIWKASRSFNSFVSHDTQELPSRARQWPYNRLLSAVTA